MVRLTDRQLALVGKKYDFKCKKKYKKIDIMAFLNFVLVGRFCSFAHGGVPIGLFFFFLHIMSVFWSFSGITPLFIKACFAK